MKSIFVLVVISLIMMQKSKTQEASLLVTGCFLALKLKKAAGTESPSVKQAI